MPASSIAMDVEGNIIDFLDAVLLADPAGSWSMWAWKADDKKYIYIQYISKGIQVILETDI